MGINSNFIFILFFYQDSIYHVIISADFKRFLHPEIMQIMTIFKYIYIYYVFSPKLKNVRKTQSLALFFNHLIYIYKFERFERAGKLLELQIFFLTL